MGAKKGSKHHFIHGFAHSRIDTIYKRMIERCYKPSCNRYYRYGGRGIRVCEEWRNDRTKFYEWAFNHGYSDDLTLDRIDNNLSYTPENCRWATMTQQQNNRSSNKRIDINGVIHTYTEWERIKGLSRGLISSRIKRGWSEYDAVMTPPGEKFG